jgi:Phage P22-like portal protein
MDELKNGILGTTDDDIVKECLQRMKEAESAESEQRIESRSAQEFIEGRGQWDESTRSKREAFGLPVLTINKLPTTLNQITNTQKQNTPGLQIHATGTRADPKTAEVIQAAVRAMEYRSQAAKAYKIAQSSAASIGFGYFRLVSKYVNADTFDQELAVKSLHDPFCVYRDPASREIDGSDMSWCIIVSKLSLFDARRKYPKARFSNDSMGEESMVDVYEYYRVKELPGTLCQLSDGTTRWLDEVRDDPPELGVEVVRKRKSYKRTVEWFKLTDCDVVERAVIPCKWVPVFPVLGQTVLTENSFLYRGVVHNAKDPAKLYNFWVSSAAEEISSRPRVPFIGALGQFDGVEKDWAAATSGVPMPYLEYKPTGANGVAMPPPQRQGMAEVPSGLLSMVQIASGDIKATTGYFDASLGDKSNETSGVAIKARDKQGETTSYHFVDNFNTTFAHFGRCVLDMWPSIYDTRRTLQVMSEDGKMGLEEVNVPKTEIDKMGKAVDKFLHDMDVREYGVTVSAGPSYDTMRQEALDGMIQLSSNWPKLMEIAGDKVIRAMDWPGANEIADRITKTLPPGIAEDGKGEEDMVQTPKGPIPKDQIGGILEQMDQQMQQMHAQVQTHTQEVEKIKLETDSRERIAEMSSHGRNDVAELQGLVKLLIARIPPPPALAQGVLKEIDENPKSVIESAQTPT